MNRPAFVSGCASGRRVRDGFTGPVCPGTRAGFRRGSILIYTVFAVVALAGICSLAVDFGHVQLVKSDLQRSADATARGSLALYQSYGLLTAQSYGPQIANAAYNPVDSTVAVAPTVSVTWGSWDSTSKTFNTNVASGLPVAVKVTVSRTAANNNPVKLYWGGLIGKNSCDLSITTIAMCVTTTSTTVTIPPTSDLYLAGMPTGSAASYDDTTSNAPAYQVTGIPVVPGTYISLTNVSGTVGHCPACGNDGPDGNATIASHGSGAPGTVPSTENGIADAKMPFNALTGVFLGSTAPSNNTAPSTRDYSTSASQNQSSYTDIQLQQPFFIGDGQTSGGVTQQFLVPPGATRLYLGTADSYEWNNNVGSFAATVTVAQNIQIVQ